MFPDDLLERNQAFVFRRKAEPLPAPLPVRLGVVTCFDPRLDPLLRPALGLAEDQGFLLRTAGAHIAPESHVLRSLALAVYMFGLREILVLGHSSCRMAAFDTEEFIEAFRGRGVAREAFGSEALRSWAGAIASPRQGVLDTAATIASSPFLPNDLEIAGGVLDDTTCKIDLVLRPGDPIPGVLPGVSGRPSEPAGTEPDGAEPDESEAGAAEPPPAPPSASPALQSVYTAVDFLASQDQMKTRLSELRQRLQEEKNPFRQLGLLQQFLQSGAADTAELRAAFGQLRHELQAEAPQFLSQVFLPLFRKGKK